MNEVSVASSTLILLGVKPHLFLPQTPQPQAPCAGAPGPAVPLMAIFIFLRTASFSTLTSALRSLSLSPSQKSRILSRSDEGPAFAFAFVPFACETCCCC